ncbi:MAG: hypothetical protein HYY25_01105 [Candidatus Wallbacteria bacterium]|nr:hypothetical protein [Candidatus Wallbacteria bacterium]
MNTVVKLQRALATASDARVEIRKRLLEAIHASARYIAEAVVELRVDITVGLARHPEGQRWTGWVQAASVGGEGLVIFGSSPAGSRLETRQRLGGATPA